MADKKLGRPTNCPKNAMVKFRIDEQTSRRLRLCSEELNVSKSEIIRRGIDRIYDDLNDK